MSESIELIEGDHILEPVEEAVAMYEDLLMDLRKFLVIPLHLVHSFYNSSSLPCVRALSRSTKMHYALRIQNFGHGE